MRTEGPNGCTATEPNLLKINDCTKKPPVMMPANAIAWKSVFKGSIRGTTGIFLKIPNYAVCLDTGVLHATDGATVENYQELKATLTVSE